jgi:hypothetical protein
MATRLDQQIEQLEDMVKRRFGLCKVPSNESRCISPANNEQTEPRHFPIELSPVAKPAGREQSLSRHAARQESKSAERW